MKLATIITEIFFGLYLMLGPALAQSGIVASTGLIKLTPLAHVFPDDYIDRTISVVVRDRHVTVVYSAGMNDVTIRQVMQQWQDSNMPPDTGAQPSIKKDPKSDNKKEKSHLPVVPRKPDSPPASNPDMESNAELSADDFSNEQALAAEFRTLAIKQLRRYLIITCNGTRIEPEIPVAQTPLRRHMSVTATYDFVLPDTKQPLQLSIVDENFAEQDGVIRLALKANGRAILAKSNVAPILIRAEPIELTDLDSDKRKQANTILGNIIQLGKE